MTNSTGPTAYLDLFIRDLDSGTTRLVSAALSGQGGGTANTGYPVVSSNGQFISFLSRASNLTANGNTSLAEVYLRDMNNPSALLVSVATNGGPGRSGECSWVDMTPDARFVAFVALQTNLATNVVSFVSNIYLRDLQGGTTELLSVRATNANLGSSNNAGFPVISGNGQRIAFYSDALDLISFSGGTPAAGQVYLRDRQTQTTAWLATNAQSFIAGPMRSFNVALSSDGSVTAFMAVSTTNTSQNVLAYCNISNGQTFLINTNVDTNFWPGISANGQRVAYVARPRVLVWDALSGSNSLASVDLSGSTNGVSHSPLISADGSRVAFVSSATNMTTKVTSGQFQLYVRDLSLGLTRLASPNKNGQASGDQELCTPSLSPDGKRVAFASADSSLVADDRNFASDVFVWSWDTGQIELVSRRRDLRPPATPAGMPVWESPIISSNGQFVAFTALDGSLVPDDTNGWSDVFVRDMLTGQTTLVSGDSNGAPATNGPASNPALSANGCYAAFLRTGPSGSVIGNIYLRDLQNGTLTLVTATNGITIGSASPPTISPDGRYVAFSTSNVLAGNDLNQRSDVYLYDSQLHTNILISVAPNGLSTDYDSSNPVFSPDGQWLVFQSKSPSLISPSLASSSIQLYARNLISNVTQHVSYAPGSSSPLGGDNSNAVFSANSRYAVFTSATSSNGNPICIHDFVSKVNQSVCANCLSPSVSSNGTKIAYTKTNSVLQIFVTDLGAGQTNLVSVANDGVSLGSGKSWASTISADGRFVIFSSKATNLISNDTNLVADVFVRDLLLNNTIPVSASRSAPGTGNHPSVNATFAADGRSIVFQSFASDLAQNDFNGSRDLFLVRLGIGDSDGDGMDDDWELAYFGNLSHDGSADSDGDGLTDLQEFRAGTNPMDGSSVLRCIALANAPNGATVYWSAVPGRAYRIEYKNSLSDASWTTLAESVTATSAVASVADSGAAFLNQRFYRCVALP